MMRGDISIDTRKHYIQPALKEEVEFYEGYMRNPFNLTPTNEPNPAVRYRNPHVSLAE